MSYPNNGIAERWIPANSNNDDPIVLNGVPYVVMQGDNRNDCKPVCPEFEVRNLGLPNEEILSTVYTENHETGFTVLVQADISIDYDQRLYILDNTPGSVLLTNVDTGGLLLWGKVFDFALSNNIVAPNNNVWLQPGDNAITGCVEAIMLNCCIPEGIPIISNGVLIVDGIGVGNQFATIGDAMLVASPGDSILVVNDTVEPVTITHVDNVDVIIDSTVKNIELGDGVEWVIPNTTITRVDSTYSTTFTTASDTATAFFRVYGYLEANQIRMTLGSSGIFPFRIESTGSLLLSNAFIVSNSVCLQTLTGNAVTVSNSFLWSTGNDGLQTLITPVTLNVSNSTIQGGVNGVHFIVNPTTASLTFTHNIIKAGSGYSLNSDVVWTSPILSFNTLYQGALGHTNNIAPIVGTNDLV